MLTPEQHAIRETGVGSSDIPAVVGLSPWRSAIDVWWSKPTPTRPALPIGDDAPAGPTAAGHEFEDAIARLYARRAGVRLRRSGTTRHKGEPWMLATPDRLLVGERRGLEVKLVGPRVAHHWDGGIPDYVLVQVDWQMLVLGFEAWDVAAMIGTDTRVYSVERDEEREALIIEAARDFWFGCVCGDTPPPPANEQERAAYLKRRYPRATEETAISTPEVESIVARYLAAHRAEQEAAERKLAAGNDLLDWLGERRGVRGEWGSASAPLVDGRIDWKAIALEIAGGPIDKSILARHRGAPARKLGVYPKRAK